MTTTRIYRSTDSGAPVLTGGVSALINVLDKCLVAGYGSKTAAGWTKPHTGTNKAAFRNSLAAGGTGMYLRVLDNASLTFGARNASVRAYLTMSSIDVGTIATPTVAQLATGIVWRKSDTTDSTPRPWILVADELTFYLCVDTGTIASEGGAGTYAAGDFASYVPGDPYRFFLAGRESAEDSGGQGAYAGMFGRHTGGIGAGAHGFWLARGYAGTGDAVRAAVATICSVESSAVGGTGLANPPPGSGLQFWSAATIVSENEFRGRLRGIYAPETSFAGVAIGTDIVNPPGLSSTLTTLRHNAYANTGEAEADGHMHADTTSEWPL